MSQPAPTQSYRETIRSLLRGLSTRYASSTYERLIASVLFVAAGLAVFVSLAIGAIFLFNAVIFFEDVHPFEFFTGLRWSPVIRGLYGVVPLLTGTFIVAGGAALIGLPVGLGAAIYMHEYAPRRVRAVMKPVLEILAGVPTVVWGFFALLVIAPALRSYLGAEFLNATNAIIAIGIMIIPMVSSLSEDALSAVPRKIRDGSLALGATRLETVVRVMVPAALSGILASYILAVSRAIGETMIVTMVVGNLSVLELNPLRSMNTLTAEIAIKSLGDLPVGSLEYQSIFALGITLFAITLLMNLISRRLLRRFREVYE